MKKLIINLLLKLLIRKEFVQMDTVQKYGAYKQMHADNTIELFKAKYTNHIVSHLVAKSDEERWMIKGRILEVLDVLNCIETADQHLEDINNVVDRSERRDKTLQAFKKRLFTPSRKT